MKSSTQIKIALVSITALFGATTMVSAASAEGVAKSNIATQNFSKSDAKKAVRTYLKNHENVKYHRFRTGEIRKGRNEWKVPVKTLNGLKVTTARVNVETGKITFKK